MISFEGIHWYASVVMLQRLTVITLVLSSHFSLCAGSLFSVGMALASHIAVSEQGIAMTPNIHRPLCALSTPNADTTGNQADDSRCDGGKKCSQTPSALSFLSTRSEPHHIVATALPAADLHAKDAGNAYNMHRSVKPPGRTGGLLFASVVRRE